MTSARVFETSVTRTITRYELLIFIKIVFLNLTVNFRTFLTFLLNLVRQLNWTKEHSGQIIQRMNARIITDNSPPQLRLLLLQLCAISNNEVEMIKVKMPRFKCISILCRYFLKSKVVLYSCFKTTWPCMLLSQSLNPRKKAFP